MLQIRNIYLSYGARLILDDISFTVASGEKVGLIGVNGAGKSSLLKIIAYQQEADRGTIVLPRTWGYLSQDIAHETPVVEGSTVRDFIFAGTGLDQAILNYEALLCETTLLCCLLGATLLSGGMVKLGDNVHLGYYAQENEGLDYENIVLGRFLFTGDRVFQKIGTLSGGEKTRLALAKMVLDGPNLLVLDEPTTHLDTMSRTIIGDALSHYNGTIIVVTHDIE